MVASCAGSPRVRRPHRARRARPRLERGEFVALLGRSGPARSTLLRSLAGLDRSPPASSRVAGRPRWCSRSRGCCHGAACSTNVALGLRTGCRGRGAGPRAGWRRSAWPTSRRVAAARCPAVRRNGFRWPARWSRARATAARRALRRARRTDPPSSMHGCCIDLWREHRPGRPARHPRRRRGAALADRVLVLEAGRVDPHTEPSTIRATHRAYTLTRYRAELLDKPRCVDHDR